MISSFKIIDKCPTKYKEPTTSIWLQCDEDEGHPGHCHNGPITFPHLLLEKPQEVQGLRIALMMYRQGWLDAVRAINNLSTPVDQDIRRTYRILCDNYRDRLVTNDEGEDA